MLFPLCLLPEGNLTFFQDTTILLLAGRGKGVLPTKKKKKRERFLTFNQVDPDQNKCFTSAPVTLHPSTPWLEIACVHTQLKSPPSLPHCPGEKEHRLCPALLKHIASCRFPPCVSRFHANPSRKSNIRLYQTLPAGFRHRMKRQPFVFYYFTWD